MVARTGYALTEVPRWTAPHSRSGSTATSLRGDPANGPRSRACSAPTLATSTDGLSGPAAIADGWLSEPDAPGSWEAEYHPLAIDGDIAVATGESRYTNGRTYSNIFVCTFDADGRCREFREWFMERPRAGGERATADG